MIHAGSPEGHDGSKIYFSDTLNLCVIDSDGSNPTKLFGLTTPTNKYFVVHVNSKLLFYGDRNLWSMNLDGSNVTPLTNYTNTNVSVYFNKFIDSKIFYTSNGALDGSDNKLTTNGLSNLWSMNLDGSDKKPVTKFDSVNYTVQNIVLPNETD
ncbi:MAG: hypothetical protein HQM16_17690 [Deltaproteobacteria bacterium]|nr:hypothetical protein [Deltaproteobacteria bacterium]